MIPMLLFASGFGLAGASAAMAIRIGRVPNYQLPTALRWGYQLVSWVAAIAAFVALAVGYMRLGFTWPPIALGTAFVLIFAGFQLVRRLPGIGPAFILVTGIAGLAALAMGWRML